MFWIAKLGAAKGNESMSHYNTGYELIDQLSKRIEETVHIMTNITVKEWVETNIWISPHYNIRIDTSGWLTAL